MKSDFGSKITSLGRWLEIDLSAPVDIKNFRLSPDYLGDFIWLQGGAEFFTLSTFLDFELAKVSISFTDVEVMCLKIELQHRLPLSHAKGY